MVTPEQRRQRYRPALPPRAPVVRASPSRPAWIGPAWGIGGFLLGIIFWHSLGFWSFVGEVVLKGPPDREERQMVLRTDIGNPPAGQPSRATGSLPAARPSMAGYGSGAAKAYLTCSVAMAAPWTGETEVSPCPPTTPPAVIRGQSRKTDRLVVAGGAGPRDTVRGSLPSPVPTR